MAFKALDDEQYGKSLEVCIADDLAVSFKLPICIHDLKHQSPGPKSNFKI